MVEGMFQCRAALYILHTGLSSSVEYQAYSKHSDWKNYSEAHAACQGYNSKHLAKINEADELTKAKRSFGYDNLKKYWTALQVL